MKINKTITPAMLKQLAQNEGFTSYEDACTTIKQAGFEPMEILNPYCKGVQTAEAFLQAAFEKPEDIALIRQAYEMHLDKMMKELEEQAAMQDK